MKHKPGGISPFVGDESMCAASPNERRAGNIVYRYTFCSMTLSSNIPPLTPTVRFSVKPLTWPVINFKRLNGMKSNYTAHVSTVRQLVRLQFERWAPQ